LRIQILIWVARSHFGCGCSFHSTTVTVCSRDQWFRQNFIISMCGIKFWKANEKTCLKNNNIFLNIERFLHFLPLSSQKKSIVPSKRWKLFSSIWRMGYKKICLFILISKLCTKEFSQKTVLPIEKLAKSPKRFLCKTFSAKLLLAWQTDDPESIMFTQHSCHIKSQYVRKKGI
jgi:hypothetical protein